MTSVVDELLPARIVRYPSSLEPFTLQCTFIEFAMDQRVQRGVLFEGKTEDDQQYNLWLGVNYFHCFLQKRQRIIDKRDFEEDRKEDIEEIRIRICYKGVCYGKIPLCVLV